MPPLAACSRAEAHQAYARLLARAREEGPEQVRAVTARLGREDLFFLLVYLLKRPDVDHDWRYARCREVQAAPNGYLDLWAREHYKSTIITFGLNLRDILRDPEVTIGIFSHTRPVAKGFLWQIKRELEENALLKELYPDVLWAEPRREAPKWSEDDGLVVKRQGNPKERTLEAWGLVDGQPTSKHFKVRSYDDVVTLESVTTPDMIKKVTQAWEVSINLGADGGAERYTGTRYHFADTYADMIARGAVIPRIHPATRDGKADGEPVMLSREALADKRRKMGPYVFGAQMLLDPMADRTQGFRQEWFRSWQAAGWDRMNRYLLVDPASEKKKGSDYTAMWVVGLAEDRNYYVIDGVRDRLNLTERARQVMRLHRLYQPRRVGYEKYGMQADIEYLKEVQERDCYRFEVVALGGQMPKPDRIRRLVPLFEQGRIFFPYRLMAADREGGVHDLTAEFLKDEYLAFPVCAHDDMLDCLARIVEPDLAAQFPLAVVETGAPPEMALTDYDLFTGRPAA